MYKTGELSLGELRTYISPILSQFEDCVSKTYIDDKYFDPNYFYEDEQGRLFFKKDAPEGKVPQPIGYTDYSNMFSMYNSGKSYDISEWNVTNVTNMSLMFDSCEVASFGDLSNWNVSNVTNMHAMFRYCEVESFGDLSNWDVSSVNDMECMFESCETKYFGDLSKWKSNPPFRCDNTF